MKSPEKRIRGTAECLLQPWCIIHGQEEIWDQECAVPVLPAWLGEFQNPDWKWVGLSGSSCLCLSEEGPGRDQVESTGSGMDLLEEEKRRTQTVGSCLGGCSDQHFFSSFYDKMQENK